MFGIGDFQYRPTDGLRFISFGDGRASMISFQQNFIRTFAPVFLNFTIFPLRFWQKVRLRKLLKCTSSQRAWSYLSFIGKRFYNTASRYDNFHCQSGHISGRDEVIACLYYHIKLKKATCCLLGAKLRNEFNLLKFKSQTAAEISLWYTSQTKYVLLRGF